MSVSEPALLLHREGAVAHIVFNRPSVLNAIDEENAQRFNEVTQAIANDAEVRAVVLRGAGRAFVTGGDLGVFERDASSVANTLIDPLHEGIARLYRIAGSCDCLRARHSRGCGRRPCVVLRSRYRCHAFQYDVFESRCEL